MKMLNLFLITYSILITVECYRLYNKPVSSYKEPNPTQVHARNVIEREELSSLFLQLTREDLKRIEDNNLAAQVNEVIKYFNRYYIDIPTHLVIDMLRIESIQTKKDMFLYLNTTRKNYAKDIAKTIPATKEALKSLKD